MEPQNGYQSALGRWKDRISQVNDDEWRRLARETGIDEREVVSPGWRAQASAAAWRKTNIEQPKAAAMRREHLSAAGQLPPPARPARPRHPLLWMRARYYGLAAIIGAVSGFLAAWLYSQHG